MKTVAILVIATCWLFTITTVTSFLNNVSLYSSKSKIFLPQSKVLKVKSFGVRNNSMKPVFMSDPQSPLPAPAPEKAESTQDTIESDNNKIDAIAITDDGIRPEEEELSPEEKYKQEKLEEIERLRSQEVFTQRKTGDFECKGCGWKYRESSGVGKIQPGTPFAELPSEFVCPVCKAPKPAFVELTETVSGFEVNKQYGLFNEMTEGSKSLLIYGGLGFFFVLFLCGYLLE